MGGQIMAQSRMAKGPDGTTNGFESGWTTRVSPHAAADDVEQDEDEEAPASSLNTSLSAAASEFVPNFPVAASGFASVETEEGKAS